jgi:hypothetical protein
MMEGHQEGTLDPEYVGGLGARGVAGLDEFVRGGGTLVAFNRAAGLPIEEFSLPLVDVLADLERIDFYIPVSILRLNLDRDHPVASGMPSRAAAWFERGLAFEATEDPGGVVEIVGRYGAEDELLLSGWVNGAEHIAGHGAVAVVRHGRGRVVLFGFRPQYRGQTVATYPLIFNALRGWADGEAATSRSGEGERGN